MKKDKKTISLKLSDLLLGGKNSKRRHISRKLIDAVVILMIALLYFILYCIISGIIDVFIYPNMPGSWLIILIFFFIAKWSITKYIAYVRDLRAERDEADAENPS